MAPRTWPQNILEAGNDAAFGTVEALARGSSDYLGGIIQRRADPVEMWVDVFNWWHLALRRDTPTWATPNQVVQSWPIARLREFTGDDELEQTPLLLLPPQAGHSSCIVDYSEAQSQVKTAQSAGLSRVYAMEWLGATVDTRDASIEDYVAVIDEAVDIIGGPVNLVGDCQGGWLGVIYAALHPERVRTLTIAGTPVDFHAGEPLIHDCVQALATTRDLAFYRAVVAANNGILPGDFLLAGFIAMQPHNELDRQLQLLAHVHEPEHVARYQSFERWFQHTQPLAGAFYLWIVEHLFRNNDLISGTLRVGGARVDLAQITAPLYLLAGEGDHITPPAQVFALAEYVSTPADLVHRESASGGHLGLFMGRQALASNWGPIFADIALQPSLAIVPREDTSATGPKSEQ